MQPKEKNHAIENAKAHLLDLRKARAAIEALDEGRARRVTIDSTRFDDPGEARDYLQETALSVQVRTDWYNPGETGARAAEYEILLTTGGPALRIIGELDQWGQPENATMQWQDWGTPWTDLHGSEMPFEPSEVDAVLLFFASCFWYGEGQ